MHPCSWASVATAQLTPFRRGTKSFPFLVDDNECCLPTKSTHQFEWSNRAEFRQCRPTAVPLSKNPSNLSAEDTPLPESLDYSLIVPISGGPDELIAKARLLWQLRRPGLTGMPSIGHNSAKRVLVPNPSPKKLEFLLEPTAVE
ncbi:hypothetical protein OUZ56_012513 [Daphnia magna]|uniref:Uncharacterized protein n=1 Tax=Daphnia magna TaxID=35525 RepID=A0ABQ9Z3A6_9CRUS|nr:hypothetical protein OUZ56_012513 [Daphnia magna]